MIGNLKQHTVDEVIAAYGKSGAIESLPQDTALAVRKIVHMEQMMSEISAALRVEADGNDPDTILVYSPEAKKDQPAIFGDRLDQPITFRIGKNGMLLPLQYNRVSALHAWLKREDKKASAVPPTPEEMAEMEWAGNRFDEIMEIYRRRARRTERANAPEHEQLAAANILSMESMLREMEKTDFIRVDRSDPNTIKVYAPDAKAEMPDQFGGADPELPISFALGKAGLLNPNQCDRMNRLYQWMLEEQSVVVPAAKVTEVDHQAATVTPPATGRGHSE